MDFPGRILTNVYPHYIRNQWQINKGILLQPRAVNEWGYLRVLYKTTEEKLFRGVWVTRRQLSQLRTHLSLSDESWKLYSRAPCRTWNQFDSSGNLFSLVVFISKEVLQETWKVQWLFELFMFWFFLMLSFSFFWREHFSSEKSTYDRWLRRTSSKVIRPHRLKFCEWDQNPCRRKLRKHSWFLRGEDEVRWNCPWIWKWAVFRHWILWHLILDSHLP